MRATGGQVQPFQQSIERIKIRLSFIIYPFIYYHYSEYWSHPVIVRLPPSSFIQAYYHRKEGENKIEKNMVELNFHQHQPSHHKSLHIHARVTDSHSICNNQGHRVVNLCFSDGYGVPSYLDGGMRQKTKDRRCMFHFSQPTICLEQSRGIHVYILDYIYD